ncbi:probable N-acetyltransferase san isoform X2 [Dermacentor andersoni]|uniref:probable N-acetyltransferase san isoform X2 n=1 Tax=Dermacentor andersoni TaxID=34620 RepID=UPI0024180FD4|nr:probable N-acetyltransferase san isoform X2 [Dermacentor andersoni]
MTKSRGCRIELGDVTPHNINQLKRLNQVVFPVSYNDKFYKDVLEAGELAKLAYYNDIVVGAVCCRIDTSENTRRLYIMTLGCLAPYRRLGIGTTMVQHVLNYVKKDGNFDSIFLGCTQHTSSGRHYSGLNATGASFLLGFGLTSNGRSCYGRLQHCKSVAR